VKDFVKDFVQDFDSGSAFIQWHRYFLRLLSILMYLLRILLRILNNRMHSYRGNLAAYDSDLFHSDVLHCMYVCVCAYIYLFILTTCCTVEQSVYVHIHALFVRMCMYLLYIFICIYIHTGSSLLPATND